ncbi:MAG: hypothetical protein WD690_05165 [Vicinamibacterales bacterium]
MKLGRKHLIASLAVLAASIVWNVWVFTQPTPSDRSALDRDAQQPLIPEAPTASGSGGAVGPPIDPMSIAPPPALDLTREPLWPRNPFAQTPLVAVPPAAGLPPQPDLAPALPVVNVIMYSESGGKSAIIDGRIVSAGDRVRGGVVVSIARDAVVVQLTSGERLRLPLRPGRDGGSE